jgi:hypothetical protein
MIFPPSLSRNVDSVLIKNSSGCYSGGSQPLQQKRELVFPSNKFVMNGHPLVSSSYLTKVRIAARRKRIRLRPVWAKSRDQGGKNIANARLKVNELLWYGCGRHSPFPCFVMVLFATAVQKAGASHGRMPREKEVMAFVRLLDTISSAGWAW